MISRDIFQLKICTYIPFHFSTLRCNVQANHFDKNCFTKKLCFTEKNSDFRGENQYILLINLTKFSQDRYVHRENYAREILVDHLRQLRSHRNTSTAIALRNDRPPAYDEVVNKPSTSSASEETEVDSAAAGNSEEPPSYSEATNSEEVTIINCNYVDPDLDDNVQADLVQDISNAQETEVVTIETRGMIHNGPNSQ